MTDSDRERKSFRSSYNRRMKSSSKVMLTSADFNKKYKGCRLVHVLAFCTSTVLILGSETTTKFNVMYVTVHFGVSFCSSLLTGIIAADGNAEFCCYKRANNKGI